MSIFKPTSPPLPEIKSLTSLLCSAQDVSHSAVTLRVKIRRVSLRLIWEVSRALVRALVRARENHGRDARTFRFIATNESPAEVRVAGSFESPPWSGA